MLAAHLAARPHASPTASGAHLRPLPDGIPQGCGIWTRTVESHHLPAGLQPAVRLADISSCVIWRPQRGSNPHPQIDNLVSWPLDDESSWWTWPDSNRLLPRARRMPCRWTTGPVVAGVGLAPTCMAYETRLELPPANPRWLQRQDSNLHMAAYETALEPFQARCSAGGVVGIRTPIVAMPRRNPAVGRRPHVEGTALDQKQVAGR